MCLCAACSFVCVTQKRSISHRKKSTLPTSLSLSQHFIISSHSYNIIPANQFLRLFHTRCCTTIRCSYCWQLLIRHIRKCWYHHIVVFCSHRTTENCSSTSLAPVNSNSANNSSSSAINGSIDYLPRCHFLCSECIHREFFVRSRFAARRGRPVIGFTNAWRAMMIEFVALAPPILSIASFA